MRLPSWLAVAVVVGFTAALVQSTMRSVAYHPEADEGYYLRYATRIAQQGLGAFPVLFQEYLHDPISRHYFPSPMRLTTVLLDALVVWIGGPRLSSLQRVSLGAFLVLLVLVFAILRRSFDESTALWTMLLVAVSPLHLAMARHALTDSLVAMLMILCLALCRRAVARAATRDGWWGVALAYMVTFLAREGTVVLIPISCALIGWSVWRSRRPVPWRLVATTSVVPLVGAAALVILAAGGIDIAWQALQVADKPTSVLTPQAGEGPWFRYLIDFLLLSPWTTLLYVFWVGYLIGARARDDRAWWWTLVPILFLVCSAPFTKNVRYALALEMPMRLGAVLMLQRLFQGRMQAHGVMVRMSLAILVLMGLDLWAFHDIFLLYGDPYDPVSAWLLFARGFLPR